MTRLTTFALAMLLVVSLIAPPDAGQLSSLSVFTLAAADDIAQTAADLDTEAVGAEVEGEQCTTKEGKCADAGTATVEEGKMDNGGDAEAVSDPEEDELQVADDDKKDSVKDDDEDNEDEEDEDDEDDVDDLSVDQPAVIDPPGKEGDTSYVAPVADGAKFFESFQGDLSQWEYTSDAEYTGKFAQGQGASPALPGDRALIIPQKARKYGISAAVADLADMSDRSLVVQYEVKTEQGMTCGGAYLKLPLSNFDADKFKGDTPYSIMFGPDKCGSTNKVHFIFQSEHPSSGKRREHHLVDTPSVPNAMDKQTHLYTVIVYKDGAFEVRVDGEQKTNGTLNESFEPPVQMPKKIDDPDDKKPGDWVDKKKIPDPDATKPDDWDEDAPREIPDADAVKPDTWLDDEPEKIPDPKAEKPANWDDDEDGEWDAPLIANPKCTDKGCGEWKRPMKANPAYKGKWSAPLIANPKYIGEWKPKQIENPEYFEVTDVKLLGIGGIGFELWTMDQGVLFDNIWVGDDVTAAEAYAKETFMKKQKIEKEIKEKQRKEREERAKAAKEQKEKEADADKKEEEESSTGQEEAAREDSEPGEVEGKAKEEVIQKEDL